MAAKSKSRKHIYRKGAEKKAKKGVTKRYGKKKSEYVYGATVGIKDECGRRQGQANDNRGSF